MDSTQLLDYYIKSPTVCAISKMLTKNGSIRLKGLHGSFDTLLVSALFTLKGGQHVIILHDKEEAAYFHNDLSNFLKDRYILFPSSYKKPYQYEEIENANILQRTEVLSKINQEKDLLIITYPDALSEKVINKRALVANTSVIRVGEPLNTEFIVDLLLLYGFERSDFVYEPNQFSVRGGIIDIFSYAHKNPYRIELFGDEIETIREFDPKTQLSIKKLEHISLIPNVQTKLIKEERQSFLSFMTNERFLWIKDYQQTLDIVNKSFQKAEDSFNSIREMSGNSSLVVSPDQLFESPKSWAQALKNFCTIEFGHRYYLPPTDEWTFYMRPQPSFSKNFSLLVDNFRELQQKNYTKYITAESFKQIERLHTIFYEIDPDVIFESIKASLRKGFIDDHEEIACYTDHQIFERFHIYQGKERWTRSKAMTIKDLRTLQTGDYVVHIDYGVGRFAGLDTVHVGGNQQEALRLIYRDNDLLYVGLHSLHKISKYSGKEGTSPSINKLGSPEWENKKNKIKTKVKDIAKDLIQLYAKRKAVKGFEYPPDNYLQAELESSFLYQDTPDQSFAIADVKADMEQPSPMDRLICGDVGFGKTEVAIRAAFKAVYAGKQVAVLVPTTILAMQHHRTFSARLRNLPVTTECISRFKTTQQINDIKKRLIEGKIDILIGTHRIISKDITFKDIGLMIVDEEQKFGVKVKEKLKELRVRVDALTLTATPIPRTLHFSLMGVRDLSIISTPPPNRRPVTTELHTFNEEVVRDAVSHELKRRGQVFIVHNRINDIERIANHVHALVPDARIGIAHGQMEGTMLEKIMLRFMDGKYDVLVSTNIIESGLDIPNANTIIINNAHMFGLSDLHQMRGRVGRSNTKAYCFMLTPPVAVLTSDARKRLATLEEFSNLGDGFNIAMRDLDIRGAGNLLGAEQSGFINDIGFDMYHKILDETVRELQETEFKTLFKNTLIKNKETLEKMAENCNIETDFAAMIPTSYVNNISERLSLYAQLDNLKKEKELDDYIHMLIDRFGPLPTGVENLIKIVRLRWKAIQIGFEKLTIKNRKMKCYVSNKKMKEHNQADNTFNGILSFAKTFPKISQIKEVKNKLLITIDEIHNVEEAMNTIHKMELYAREK